ncbi:hypothetical protein JCGZ_12303 [Jatropha curcas]|uniref:Uncharacterized protein n=1 Tax=Jatropha curcas TaxID=180498 RepID=A0A067K6W0_JATCU|nr:hypothetical protein JCGZ_12303 [Jatropha curcas]
MAFVIPQTQQSLSSSEDSDNQTQLLGPISKQLYIKSTSSSSSSSSSKALDKEVILKRIRHHRSLNKVKNAFQSFMSSSDSEHKRWLDPEDAFSSP